MFHINLRNYLRFARKALLLLGQRKGVFVLFVFLSLVMALTEGVGVALLVPVLESMGQSRIFSSIPILNEMSELFNAAEPGQNLRFAAFVMLSTIILRGALLYVVQYLAVAIPLTVRRDLIVRSYNTLISASMDYISSAYSGTLQNISRTLPDRVMATLGAVANVIINVLVVCIYLVLMVSISWQMTLAVFAFLFIVSEGVKAFTHNRVRRKGEHLTARTQAINQLLYETLNGLRLIRLSTAERRMMERWSAEVDHELYMRKTQERLRQSISPIFATAAGALICLLILAASFADDAGGKLGSTILFMFLLFRLLSPVTALNISRAAIQADMSAFEETEKFFSQVEAAHQTDGARVFSSLTQGISVKGVDFAYPAGEKGALHNVTLEIPKGVMMAIVGPSGAGKSTLVGLLTRFYDPAIGVIEVDGVDLRDLQISTWRKKAGMVSQDIVLFNDTVFNNIAFGREDASQEDVQRAAELACADKFIKNLAQGYDTLLGERGARLSGGQQQRIALARAILVDPELLILDEATSHLDSITEKAIQEAVERLRHQRTIIVIAHRLSTIRRADVIVVMEEGRIVEQGTHNNLLAARGKYWDMIQHQQLDLVSVGGETEPVPCGDINV